MPSKSYSHRRSWLSHRAKLSTYSGERLKAKGECKVAVEYHDQQKTLPLVVVEGRGPNLLGRNWLSEIKLDWKAINKVKSDSALASVLDNYPDVFREELGTLKGHVRLCGDFKLTVNKASQLDKYPIPKIEDLFAKMAGGQKYTKLDLYQAYQQMELEEESRRYVVINTHRGLFEYTRLPFGVSSAPGIFQRVMESILRGIPNVVVYLDDILITGPK